jgi:hypothetical protein
MTLLWPPNVTEELRNDVRFALRSKVGRQQQPPTADVDVDGIWDFGLGFCLFELLFQPHSSLTTSGKRDDFCAVYPGAGTAGAGDDEDLALRTAKGSSERALPCGSLLLFPCRLK